MNRCATCKWWTDQKHEEDGYGRCELAYSGNGMASDTESLAVAQDYESYGAWLVTHGDFGCVQWEQNEDGSKP